MNPRVALWLARAAAWSLLLGGWLVFGTLGLFWAPRAEWALAPLALWLPGIALVLRATRRRASTPTAGALLLLASAAATAAGLWAAMHGGGWPALLAAVPCGSVLLVAASRTVRRLRFAAAAAPGHTDRRDSPAGPALAGALTVALLFSDPADPQLVAAAASVLLLAAAGLLAALPVLAGGRGRHAEPAIPSAPGCRPALFDCALPGPGGWRGEGAARLAMLPLMSTLSWTLAWCQGTVLSPQAMLALHLAAMFLPAFLVQRLAGRRLGNAWLPTAAGLAMAAGALALLDADPLRALLRASLLQGVGWSLAWAALLAPAGRRPGPQRLMRPAARARTPWLGAALLNAALLSALGAALGRFGLPALVAVHAALGVWAAVGACAARRRLPIVAFSQR